MTATDPLALAERLEAIDHMSVEDCFLQSPMFAKAATLIRSLASERDELQRNVDDAGKLILGHLRDKRSLAARIVEFARERDEAREYGQNMTDRWRKQIHEIGPALVARIAELERERDEAREHLRNADIAMDARTHELADCMEAHLASERQLAEAEKIIRWYAGAGAMALDNDGGEEARAFLASHPKEASP